MQEKHLVDIRNLSVRYPDAQETILHDVNLTISAGEITCVIGESGSGKSTLLNAVLQLPGRVEITDGQVLFRGNDLQQLTPRQMQSIRGREIGVVFQEPGASLDPIRKIHKQFYDALHAHDRSVTKAEARQKAAALLQSMEFKDPERILESCPAQLSGGMNQRVAIAAAMALEPAILLADEPTSALDVTVQAQVVEELLHLRAQYGTSILLITHNMGVAAKLADQVAVMYGGRIVECGPRNDVLHHPAHPYTRALLAAVPRLDEKLPQGIPGRKPEIFPERNCSFASRCPYAEELCKQAILQPHTVSGQHWTLCGKEAPDHADNS